MEVWKDIEGFIGYFQISNLGNVRSLDRLNTFTRKGTTFKSKVKGLLMKKAIDKMGYEIITLESSMIGIKKTFRVHRLVCYHFIPNPKNKKFVNHKDGIKTNNKSENLEWVTPKENCVHAHKLGLVNNAKGENHYRSNLNEETVFKIKYGKFEGMSHSEIGKLFVVRRLQVLKIRNGINWKHI